MNNFMFDFFQCIHNLGNVVLFYLHSVKIKKNFMFEWTKGNVLLVENLNIFS